MRRTALFFLISALLIASAGIVAAVSEPLSCHVYPNSHPTNWPGYGAICAGSDGSCTECVAIDGGHLIYIAVGS